jgi:hypothetical protein
VSESQTGADESNRQQNPGEEITMGLDCTASRRRSGLSRAERTYIYQHAPSAFAGGALASSMTQMILVMCRIMPEFVSFSLHGLGASLLIALVAIALENMGYRVPTSPDSDGSLSEMRKRFLLLSAALGAAVPAAVNLLFNF